MNVSVIIVAAGTGKRMGGKIFKQLLDIKGKPVLFYSIKPFEELSLINEIVLVVNRKIIGEVKFLVQKYKFKKIKAIISGGSERQKSVYKGLLKAKPDSDGIVLVHDGVRPVLKKSLIIDVIENAILFNSAVPALPVKETLKITDDGLTFYKTLEREKIWSIQTPQGFNYSMIMKAYQRAEKTNFHGTDDASLLEHSGFPSKIVLGSPYNIKVTTPQDIELAKFYIKSKYGD